MTKPAKKLAVNEFRSMVQKMIKEALEECGGQAPMVQQEATDPETGLDLNGVMAKIKDAKDAKEMAYYIAIFQRLSGAHL